MKNIFRGKMILNKVLQKVKRTGVAFSLLLYPLFAGFAFAVHPDLLNLEIGHDVLKKIDEFHGNTILHFAHFLMLLGCAFVDCDCTAFYEPIGKG